MGEKCRQTTRDSDKEGDEGGETVKDRGTKQKRRRESRGKD